MVILQGIGVGENISFGTLYFNENGIEQVPKYKHEDLSIEKNRVETAVKDAISETSLLYEKTMSEGNETEAGIFEVHKMMMEDTDYLNSIFEVIQKDGFNSEYAVVKASEKFSQMFLEMSDEYMRSRAADVKDIEMLILKYLINKDSSKVSYDAETIIFSKDLTPSEVSGMNKDFIKGCILSEGSSSSHASILARVRDIPMVIGLENSIKPEYEGMEVAIDSTEGKVYISPDTDTLVRLKEKKISLDKKKEALNNLKGKENITLDGHKINLYANIDNSNQIDEVLKSDAGGIGLFRSEFLYLSRDSEPSEDEQFEAYKCIAEKMNGNNVIIRTLDVGSDKNADYFEFDEEENPAMGYRGIRVCLDNPEMFITQLCAIYRASAYGKISIMFPMIASVEEVRAAKHYAEIARQRLTEKQIPFDKDVKLGVMIETPAAVMLSDILAKEVDFFSIGTNDLTQYTFAVDRQNSKVSKLFSSQNLAVLRMIKIAVDNAHSNEIWVGICGEMAADSSLTETFLSMGVDELSMSAPSILKIRKKVLETNVEEIREEILKKLNI